MSVTFKSRTLSMRLNIFLEVVKASTTIIHSGIYK